jgi:hypothetical protein
MNILQFRPVLAFVFAAALVSSTAYAEHLDILTFGDAASEKEHAFSAQHSDVIEGGMGLRARRILPTDPPSYQSGTLAFSMRVDAAKQNYVTVKFWGSDRGGASGRLLLFSEGKQIGYRDEGDYDVLNQIEDEPSYPGRFVYVTLPLPPALTRGRKELPLSIGAIGHIWPYGTTFEVYQHKLDKPSRGIYAVYTHTETRFVPPAGEKQGEPPPAEVRSKPGREVLDRVKARVNDVLKGVVKGTVADKGDESNIERQRELMLLLLARAYVTPWTSGFGDERILQRIIREGDAFALDQIHDPAFVSKDWQGAGPLGEALVEVYPQLSKRLDEAIDDDGQPATPPISRRQAWAKLLLDSREYWRTHRRFYTNQSMIVDRNIYAANRGLRLLDPANAFPEEKARRYLYEAVGIEPWLGSDNADGSSVRPYGSGFYLVTRKGLTRELGYVGTYGETILNFTAQIQKLSGDEKVREQLRKLAAARVYFRYPLVDGEGFKAMRLESIIDNRTAHYPGPIAYTNPDIREGWQVDIPAVLKDADSAGVLQQCLEDNQFFSILERRLRDGDSLIIKGLIDAVNDYEIASKLPPSARRLPMSPGQPDFAWADEEAGVLALRRGEQKLFINLYYRSERGVNGVARIHELSPQIERVATVRSEFEVVSSGKEYTRPDWIDGIRSRGHVPPGEAIHQAWAGEKLPIAARPADATLPKYGDWGPFVGKAAFYTLRYGDYLIGMNCSYDKSYALSVPAGSTFAPDLISGKSLSLAEPVQVPPLSTVVLYLGK